MRRALVTAASLGVLAAAAAGAAAAPATTCNSSTSLSGTINGDVSAGPGCDLSGVTSVRGSVRVVPGGSLTIAFGSSISIKGELTSWKAAFIDVEGGSIAGNVRIEATAAGGQ